MSDCVWCLDNEATEELGQYDLCVKCLNSGEIVVIGGNSSGGIK